MGKIFLSFVFVLLVMAVITSTEGLKCYTCLHVSGFTDDQLVLLPTPIKGHKSCKSGKTPDKDYEEDCEKYEDISPVCMKLTSELSWKEGEKPFEITVRGCAHLNPSRNITKVNSCSTKTATDLLEILTGPLRDFFNGTSEEDLPIPPDTKGNLCTCDSDKCNPATSLRTFFHAIWIVRLLLLPFTI